MINYLRFSNGKSGTLYLDSDDINPRDLKYATQLESTELPEELGEMNNPHFVQRNGVDHREFYDEVAFMRKSEPDLSVTKAFLRLAACYGLVGILKKNRRKINESDAVKLFKIDG